MNNQDIPSTIIAMECAALERWQIIQTHWSYTQRL